MRKSRSMSRLALSPFAALIAGGLLVSGSAQAQIARQRISVDIAMAADRSVTWTQHREGTVLSPAALQPLTQARLPVSGNQTLEILEAATRKADGRVIPVEPSEIATQDGAVGPQMSFVDLKVKQVSFRDVAVGDTVVLTVRYTEKEHYIPGQFSWRSVIVPDGIEEAIDVRLEAPADVPIRHSEHNGIAYAEERGEGGSIVRRWTGTTNPPPTAEKNIADLEFTLPRFDFSTFASYEAIGQAYAQAAESKAQVTPTLRALADTITGGRQDPRDQADAIFEWITRNVRYVAVYFGAGRYVPNDVDTILARRFGDCKDKATLMTALLAAKGISAEQVLINAGPSFTLPDSPVLQAFNHAIVYIPSLDVYVDPTTPTSTFRHPPSVLMDKPVVRASASGGVLARTPVDSAQENVATVSTRTVIAGDGRITSDSTVEATGGYAQSLRWAAAIAEARGPQAELDELTRGRGMPGKATFEAPSSFDHREPYRIRTTWESERPAQLVERGWRVLPGLSPIVPGASAVISITDPSRRVHPILCRPGRVVQDHTVELPETVVLKSALPEPVSLEVPGFSMKWAYSRESERLLKMRIEVASTVSSYKCPPEMVNAVIDAVEDAKEQFRPLLRFSRADAKGLD